LTRVGRSIRVAIIGGGLAGLAAAARLIDSGLEVDLFEARRHLGGRAGSFVGTASESEPGAPGPERSGGPAVSTHHMIDYGQHVSMGCCTALHDLLRRADLADTFQTHRRLHLISPEGRLCTLAAAWLPAPLHLLPSLLRLNYLRVAERCQIVRAIWAMRSLDLGAKFLRKPNRDREGAVRPSPDLPETFPASAESIAAWLHRHGQSPRAMDLFWSPVLVSALSETLPCASLRLARKVIVDGLLASRWAYQLRVPRLPLAEIFDRRLGQWLDSRGVKIHRLTRVVRITGDSRRAAAVVLSAPSAPPGAAVGLPSRKSLPAARCLLPTVRCLLPTEFDAVVLAVPWDRVARLLSPELLAAMPELKRLEGFGPAAITTVHLTYDRPITGLPHAALAGRLGQWVFAGPGNRYQVVVSASHHLVDCSREELGRRVERELADVFPAAAGARVVHRRVVVQPRAVFSASLGIEDMRPPQETPIENLALAGDWTATGWPATMEGAVRSGNAAAEWLLRSGRLG